VVMFVQIRNTKVGTRRIYTGYGDVEADTSRYSRLVVCANLAAQSQRNAIVL